MSKRKKSRAKASTSDPEEQTPEVRIRTGTFNFEMSRFPRPKWLPSLFAAALLAAHTKLH